jgi:hypothetical protein
MEAIISIMKKRIYLILVALGVLFLFNTAAADSPAPGTTDDPLITKSYLDKYVKDMISNTGNNGSSTTTGTSNNSSISIIQLQPNQTLYAGAGTEFIVRTGKTVAVSNDENGIPDVTAGKDIAAGQAIENNHMLIFPREGRGIKPAPKNTQDIFVMVRGAYTILNADGTKAAP